MCPHSALGTTGVPHTMVESFDGVGGETSASGSLGQSPGSLGRDGRIAEAVTGGVTPRVIPGSSSPTGDSLRERAFQAIQSGIMIVDITAPDQPIVDVNQGFCEITGYASDEVIGRNGRFLQGANTDPAAVRQMRQAIAARTETTLTVMNYRRDGEPFWNEVHLAPIRFGDRPVTHFVGFQLDVTERERNRGHALFLTEATAILGQTLDFDTTLLDLARLAVPRMADWCGVDLVDGNSRVKRTVSVRAGGSGVKGLDESIQMVDVPSPREVDPDAPTTVIRTGEARLVSDIGGDREAASSFLGELARDGMTSVLVMPLIARGRTLGALSLAVGPSARRYVTADLEMATSLAARTAMAIDNARLFADQQTAVRAREQFLSVAAHELRTPISSIKGYAQLLQRAHSRLNLTPERLRRSIGTIVTASERLALLTDDLLDVSRLQLDHLPLRTRKTDYGELARSVTERHADVDQDHHAITLTVVADPCEVRVDPERIEQVLVNLLENATKYSPEGGDIDVRIWVESDRVYTEIRDAGIGMTAEALEGAFEPFVRSAEAVERGIPGLGLGLYICRGIIARHGGGIHAEALPGGGMSVSFWLPCGD